MTLAALVALGALAIAAYSLARLSRLPKAPPPPLEDRTFASLREGDVVLTPQGDFLVEARSKLDGSDLFALRSGREKRWLMVPPEGAVALVAEPPQSAGGEISGKLERSKIDLLPGG